MPTTDGRKAVAPRIAVALLLTLGLIPSLALPIRPAEAAAPAGANLATTTDPMESTATGPDHDAVDRLVVQVRPRGLAVASTRVGDRLPDAAMRALDGFPDRAIVELPEPVAPEEATELADELVRNGTVTSAEPDRTIRTLQVPDDPLWSYQWGPSQRGMTAAWSITTGQLSSPVVAVLDTGVTETSELTGRVLGGYNALNGSGDATDANGHGTLSATVIAARGDNGTGMAGQCWHCRILPVKALEDSGNGSMADLAVGVRWAVDNGADIINISAGGDGTISALDEALNHAERQGVLVVASAGNDARDAALHPAVNPTVLSVAGAEESGNPYPWTNHGSQVDVAAPGCNVAQVPDGRFAAYYCGTSSAAPFVSGLLALALDADPGLTPAAVRRRAQDTADQVAWVRSGIVTADVVSGAATTQPPPDPVRLAASANGLSVSLSWNATSGGSATDHRYDVHRSAGATCGAGSPRVTTTARLSYTDRDVRHGDRYTYCVIAEDGAGQHSQPSSGVAIAVHDSSPPASPSLVGASPGDRSVDLAWTAVADPTGPVTYRVHRSTSGGCSTSTSAVWEGTATAASFEGLRNGVPYTFCVSAADAAGNRSTTSATRTLTPSRGSPQACTALTGDWDASGRTGIGWWCDGDVRLRTAAGDVHRFYYGRAGDVPIVADWNGDGRETVSIIRDGTWHLNNRLAGGASDRTFVYGRVTRGDVPIAGAWFGGELDQPAIIRDREWHLRATQRGGPADLSFIYGRLTAGDLPLSGDWNGDGRETIGIVRQGDWHLRQRNASGTADLTYRYGRVLLGDTPVTGDWNHDGGDTPGIVRDGVWMLKHRHGGGDADQNITFRAP